MPSKKQRRRQKNKQPASSPSNSVTKTLTEELQRQFPFSSTAQELQKQTKTMTGNVYLLSNDQGMRQCSEYLKTVASSEPSSSSSKPENSCALLVGESYLLSIIA
jgi:hypothetical protein